MNDGSPDGTVSCAPVTLQGFDTEGGRSRTFTFNGRQLAEATSQAGRHAVPLIHDEGGFAAPGTRCSACRWFEVRIYAVADDDPTLQAPRTRTTASGAVSKDANRASEPATRPATEPTTDAAWVIETVGRTIVPGESDRRQFRLVREPRQVVASLVQVRARYDTSGRRTNDDDDVFIPATSRRVLDQAADADPRLADVVDQILVFD